MSSVDERVVEMRFDNDQFEHGVQQTLSSLDKLKEGLKFNNIVNGMSGLANIGQALNLKSIDKNISSLNHKFSALGLAGQEVAKRVANSAITAVKNVTTALPAQIKNGGWARASNLAQAQFQLKGLGVEWKNVGNDISYAVNQTSYGLDEAAKVAGQLAASGVKAGGAAITSAKDVSTLADKWDAVTGAQRKNAAQTAVQKKDLDQMSVALRAISGVASMTGSSYTEIGQIFSRVAGQGRVYATDLNSLAVRGLNATAILGEQLGKSEDEIRKMTKKGEIDFNVFSNAMYNAFANQATKANDTFTGSLANMKAALSRIGADVADDILPAGTKVFNSLRLMFNQVHTTIQPILDSLGKAVVAGGNTIAAIIDTITGKMKDGGKAFTTPVQVIAKAIDGITVGIEAIGKKFGLKEFVANTKEVVSAFNELDKKTHTLANIRDGFANIGKVVGNVASAIKDSIEWTVRDWSKDLGKVNASTISQQFKDFTAGLADSEYRMQRMRLIIGNFVNALGMVVKPLVSGVKTFGQALSETLQSAYKGGAWVAAISWRLRELGQAMVLSKDGTKGLKDVFTALLSPLRVIIPAIAKVVEWALQLGKVLAELNGKFLDWVGKSNVIGKAGDALTKFGDGIGKAFKKIQDAFKSGTVTQKIGDTFTKIGKVFKDSGMLDRAASGIKKIGSGLSTAFSSVKDWAKNSNFFQNIGKWLSSAAKGIGEFVVKLGQSEGFNKFVDSAQRLLSVIGGGLLSGLESLGNLLGNVGTKLSGVKFEGNGIDKLVQFFSTIGEKLSGVMDSISSAIEGKNPFEVLGKWFSDFGKDLKKNTITGGIIDFFQKLDIGKALSSVFKSIQDALDGFKLGDSLKKLFQPLHDALFGVDVMAGELGEDKAVDTVKKQGGGLGSALKSFGDGIKSAVTSVDWKGIAEGIQNGVGKVIDVVLKIFSDPRIQTIAKDLYAIVNAFMVLRLLKNASSMFKSFAGLGDSIGGFFDSLSNRLKGNKNVKSKLKDFTECIALLAGCVAGLSFAKKYAGDDNYGAALGTISGMIVGCAAILIAIGKLHLNTDNIDSFTKGMKNLGIGLATMVGALGVLALIPPELYGAGVAKLAIMMAAIAACIGIMNKISGGNQVSKAPFVGFAVAIGILVPALAILGRMDFTKYNYGMSRLGVLMLSLGVVIGVMNRISGEGSSVKFGTLLGFALSLFALMKALDQVTALAKSDSANNYANLAVAAGAIAGIFIAFGGALRLASTNEHGTGEAVAFVADIMAVTIALNSLVGTVQDAGSYVPLIAAAAAISGVFIAFGGALALAGTNEHSTGTAVAMIFDIIAVFAALKELSAQASDMQGIKSLATAAAAMSGVMIAFGVAMKLASSQKADAGSIIQMVATIGTVALSLYAIAQYPWQQIAAAGASLAGCLLALSVAMKIMEGNKGMSAGGIITMVAAVASVAGSLMLLSQIPFQNIIGAAVGMAAGFAALAAGIAMLSKVSGNALGVLASLASLGAGLAVAGAGIAVFGAAVEVAAAGISAGFAMIANAIGSVLAVIPGTKKIGNALKDVGDSINKFNAKTVTGQGKAIGGFIDGIKNGGDEADKAGDKVNKAGDKYQNGANKVEAGNKKMAESSKMASTEIDASTTAMANNAQKASDTGEGVVTAVDDTSSKITAKLGDFKNMSLKDLVPDFGDGSKILDSLGINMDGVSADLQGEIKGMLGNMNFGDIASAVGENGSFDIHKLIPDDIWAKMPEELQTQFSSALGKMDFSSATANMGGDGIGLDLVKKLFGGDQATAAAKDASSKVGQTYVQGVSESVSQASSSGGQMNTNIIANLQQNNDSFRQAGDEAGKAYAEGISNSAGTNLSGLTLVNQAINAIRTGSEVFTTEGQTAGQNYANGLGQGMNTAGLAVSTAVDQAVNLVRNLSSVFTSEGQTAGQNYAQGLSSGAQGAALAVSTMVNQAVNSVRSQASAFLSAGMACGQQFVQGLTQGGQNAGNAVRSMAMQARNALSSMSGVFRTTGTIVIQAFVSGLTAGGQTAAGAARSVSNQAASALRAGASQAGAAGRAVAMQFQIGIYAGGAAAVAAARSIANQAGSALAAGSGYAYSSGVHLGQNFANGVRAGGAAAVAAAQSIAAQVAAVLKHSKPKKGPLKDDDVWGKHMAQNLAKGMEDGTPLVGKAATNMAGKAAKSVKSAGKDIAKATASVGKTVKTNTAKTTADIMNEINSGIGRVTKSTVSIDKIVNDAWKAANDKYSKKNKKKSSKKSSSSDSTSGESDTQDKITSAFISQLNKDIEKAKKLNQLSFNDEVKGWKLALEKVKKNASAAKDAQKNANDAIYEAAESFIDKRKKQRGDYLTDESIYWDTVLKVVDKGSDAYEKSLDKFNDAILSDAEHQTNNLSSTFGKYVVTSADAYSYILRKYEKDDRVYYATKKEASKKMLDGIINDTKNLISEEERVWGKGNFSSYSWWRPAVDRLEAIKKDPRYKEFFDESVLDEAKESAADALVTDVDDLISKMNIWKEITPENFYDNEKVETVKYYKDLVDATAVGTQERLALEQQYVSKAEDLYSDYNSNVRSEVKSQMDAISLLSETTYSDAVSAEDMLRRMNNAHAAESMRQEYLDTIRQRGILSQEFLNELASWNVKDFKSLGTIANMSTEQLLQLQKDWDGTFHHSLETAKQNNQYLIDGLDGAYGMVKNQLKSKSDDLFGALTKNAQSFVADISNEESINALIKSIEKLQKSTLEDRRIQSMAANVKTLGGNLSIGLANGITSQGHNVSTAMANVVTSALNAAQKAADSHSPSRKTMWLGNMIGQGLVIGMEQWAESAANAGSSLSDSALSGFEDYYQYIQQMTSMIQGAVDHMNLAPTISPVMDMSSVDDAEKQLSLLTSEQKVRAILNGAASLNGMGQNGVTNTDNSTRIDRVNINIYPQAGQDANAIADTVLDRLNDVIIRKGKVYYG